MKLVNRDNTPWLIVGGHRPMYISSTYRHWPDGDVEVSLALKAALEPLFYKYKVGFGNPSSRRNQFVVEIIRIAPSFVGPF